MSLTDEDYEVFENIIQKADGQDLDKLLNILNREIYLESCAKQYESDEDDE